MKKKADENYDFVLKREFIFDEYLEIQKPWAKTLLKKIAYWIGFQVQRLR